MTDTRFEALLRTRIGLDPDSIGHAFIDRAIAQRVADRGCATRDDYWAMLADSEDEQHSLVELVVVPETWFFRYPEALAECARAASRLLAQDISRPVRVLSLPCSTGEEPYSIAMALLDHGVARADFIIEGLDVSAHALARARIGRYSRNAFRSTDLSFRDRHFLATEQGDELASNVRDCVTFRQENMFALSADTLREPYDIVFCRNLLIYLDAAAQGRALDILLRLCKPGGVLFAGPAEANLLSRAGYETCGSLRAFAFSRPDRHADGQDSPMQDGVNPGQRPAPIASGIHRRAVRVAADRVRDDGRGQGGGRGKWVASGSATETTSGSASPQTATDTAASDPDDISRYAWIQSLADSGRVEQAARAAQHAMRTDGLHAQLFYLLGLCQDAQGDVINALKNYRKTLYLEPNHVAALSHLAAVLESQGDVAGASRLRRRASREEARGV